MSHFNVLLIVWAKSQDGVHKPHILNRKQTRSGSNRGPSAYQSSVLPLDHTGSRFKVATTDRIYFYRPMGTAWSQGAVHDSIFSEWMRLLGVFSLLWGGNT